jgi:hypothetical protein
MGENKKVPSRLKIPQVTTEGELVKTEADRRRSNVHQEPACAEPAGGGPLWHCGFLAEASAFSKLEVRTSKPTRLDPGIFLLNILHKYPAPRQFTAFEFLTD